MVDTSQVFTPETAKIISHYFQNGFESVEIVADADPKITFSINRTIQTECPSCHQMVPLVFIGFTPANLHDLFNDVPLS